MSTYALSADEEENIRAEFPRWGVTDYENRAFHRLLATLDAERATIAKLRAALDGLRDEVAALAFLIPGDHIPYMEASLVLSAIDRAALATARVATCSAESDQQVSATKEAGG